MKQGIKLDARLPCHTFALPPALQRDGSCELKPLRRNEGRPSCAWQNITATDTADFTDQCAEARCILEDDTENDDEDNATASKFNGSTHGGRCMPHPRANPSTGNINTAAYKRNAHNWNNGKSEFAKGRVKGSEVQLNWTDTCSAVSCAPRNDKKWGRWKLNPKPAPSTAACTVEMGSEEPDFPADKSRDCMQLSCTGGACGNWTVKDRVPGGRIKCSHNAVQKNNGYRGCMTGICQVRGSGAGSLPRL